MTTALDKIRAKNEKVARYIEIASEDFRKVKGGDIYMWGALQGTLSTLLSLGIITEDDRSEILKGV